MGIHWQHVTSQLGMSGLQTHGGHESLKTYILMTIKITLYIEHLYINRNGLEIRLSEPYFSLIKLLLLCTYYSDLGAAVRFGISAWTDKECTKQTHSCRFSEQRSRHNIIFIHFCNKRYLFTTSSVSNFIERQYIYIYLHNNMIRLRKLNVGNVHKTFNERWNTRNVNSVSYNKYCIR